MESGRLNTDERLLVGFAVLLVVGVLGGLIALAITNPSAVLTIALAAVGLVLFYAACYGVGALVDKWGA